MNTSEETVGITAGLLKDAAVEVTRKAMEVTKELLKVLILKASERANRDQAKAGANNTVNKLLSQGNNLNAPIQVDKQDVKALYRLAKEHHIPISVVQGKEGSRVFFRESDLGRVSEMMKELLQNKLAQESMKQVVMSKEDAALFKSRAKTIDVPVTFLKHENQVKVSFKESDIAKVQLILDDVKEHKEKIPARQIKFDRMKDQMSSLVSGKPTLRLYDKELNKSIRMELPITKKAFIHTVRSEFGYSHKEAVDLASRVKNGKEADALFTGLKDSFEWKPDIKALSSQVSKLGTNIKLSNESSQLQGFSFSSLELADSAKTKILTIMNKDSKESYSTSAVATRTELEKDLISKFGVNEQTASEMADKAAKLGYVSEAPQKGLTNKELLVVDGSKTGLEKYGISVQSNYFDDGYFHGTKLEFSTNSGEKHTYLGLIDERQRPLTDFLMKNFGADQKQLIDLQKDKVIGQYLKEELPKPSQNRYDIIKSNNSASATISKDGKTFKADLNNREVALQGLQSTFGLSRKSASSLYSRAQNQGVKEVVRSVETKYQQQKTQAQAPALAPGKSVKSQGAR